MSDDQKPLDSTPEDHQDELAFADFVNPGGVQVASPSTTPTGKHAAVQILNGSPRGSKDTNLRECYFCKKPVRRDQPSDALRMGRSDQPPKDDDPIIGWTHKDCALNHQLKMMQQQNATLNQQLLGATSLAASLLHAAGGCIKVTTEDVKFASDNDFNVKIERNDDGSFTVQDPGALIRTPQNNVRKLILP